MINLKTELMKYSINHSYIDQYLLFISEKSLDKKIKYKSQIHHILPKSYFPEFSNFSRNSWNMSILTHSNHLYAHYLLSKMMGGSMTRAFYAMCNIDKTRKVFEENMDFYMEEYEYGQTIHLEYFSANNPAKKESNINRMKYNNPMFNPETRKKVSEVNLSKNYTFSHKPETIQIMRESKLGAKNPMYGNTLASSHLNNSKFTCIHCGKTSNKGNIIRWHNDNCKNKNI